MSGDRPPPCESCTLTAIDSYTVLMFGGSTRKKDLNDLYVMDFAAMVSMCLSCAINNSITIVMFSVSTVMTGELAQHNYKLSTMNYRQSLLIGCHLS